MIASACIDDRVASTLTDEGDGWLLWRKPEPGLAGRPPAELLALSALLPGHFRYAIALDGGVVLLGEVRERGAADVVAAGEKFPRLLAAPGAEAGPIDEMVEAALDQSALAWKRREEAWVVPATELLPREVQVKPATEGVSAQAVLVEWDEIGAVETAAAARFLCRAQAGLRFARCELDAHQARVVALVEAGRLERDLALALGGVAAGVRLLAREVGALLAPEVARAFLDFSGAPAEKADPVQA